MFEIMHRYFLQISLILIIVHTITTKRTFIHKKQHTLTTRVADHEKWFLQKLDHFDPNNKIKWKQRYFINQEYYKENSSGPVFLFVSGEEEASMSSATEGLWVTYAQQFNAIIFQLEHRYYGCSRPTSNLSVENLQYLTSKQALGDIVFFIKAMNKIRRFDENVKWILFGCSYAGTLAVWARLKYPNLVFATVSTGAPLEARLDFKDYFKVVYDALDEYDEKCKHVVKDVINQVLRQLKDKSKQQYITKELNLCDPVDDTITSRDISGLVELIVDSVVYSVQYNEYSNSTKQLNDSVYIEKVCSTLMNGRKKELIERLGTIAKLVLENQGKKCGKYRYENAINLIKNVSWSSEDADGTRQWTYQTCNEFGFFQPHSLKPQFFDNHVNLEYYLQRCVDAFGPKFNRKYIESAAKDINKRYGGLNIKVDNVVIVHATMDPWHRLGIVKDTSMKSHLIVIKGTTHCTEVYTENVDDPDVITSAREQIKEVIQSWLH